MKQITVINSTISPNDPMVDLAKCITVSDDCGAVRSENHFILAEVRKGGNLAGKAIYLNTAYDWVLGTDAYGILVVVPQKRSKA